jgi:pilus assembly protein FimV
MNSNTRISAKAFLAVATLAASPAAWALGLGDATVDSYLNQPLKARIDLVTQETDDLSSVNAKLASAADYELIGASLEDVSVPVRFTVEDIDGEAYLLASSNLPMNNPVVRLIVEVNWSSGRMLREYTLFLDPPLASDQAAPLPRIEERKSPPPPPVETEAEQPPAAVPSEPEATTSRPEATSVASTPTSPSTGEYGPVASGETLWGIAKDWSAGTGLGINKVMIAIQRENPDAFMNGNINLLKRGAILRMPAVNDVERISNSTAYSEVVTQEEAFRERKSPSLAASTEMPLLSADSSYPGAARSEPEPEPVPDPEPVAVEPDAVETDLTGTEEAAVEPEAELAESSPPVQEPELAEPEPEEPVLQDQLELVPPSETSDLDSTYGFEESEQDGDAAVATQALRENLARTEEELITQQQQNEYLEERIRELEAQLDTDRDAQVEDADLAGMEDRLREQRLATQSDDAEQPWYARLGVWLLGLLVLVAAVAGWLFSRRSQDTAGETIQDITDEAEEVLRVLEDPEPQQAVEEPAAEAPEDTVEMPLEDEAESKATERFTGTEVEADVLDEESSDPEIQLDLARAYISMGDKEAARVILEEVVANGSGEQQAEARKMLDLM